MVGIGHKCNRCPFKLTCENCFLELTLYTPNQYSIEEFMQKTTPFLSGQLKAVNKQKDGTYNVEILNGQTLRNVKFELTYICKVSVESKQQQPTQQSRQCLNYNDVEEGEIAIKTVIYKKPSTNQETKIPMEILA